MSPATDKFYDTSKNTELLVGDKRDKIHSVTQKLLHVTKRAIHNIDTLVAFQYTWVTKITVEYWYKFIRVLKWLNHTIDDKHIMGMGEDGI